jgi:hypothetical protein
VRAWWAIAFLIGLYVGFCSHNGLSAMVRDSQNESRRVLISKNISITEAPVYDGIAQFLWDSEDHDRSTLCSWSDPIQPFDPLIYRSVWDRIGIAKPNAILEQIPRSLSMVVYFQLKMPAIDLYRFALAYLIRADSSGSSHCHHMFGAAARDVSPLYEGSVFQKSLGSLGLLSDRLFLQFCGGMQLYHGSGLVCGGGGVAPRRGKQTLHVARLDAGVSPQSVRGAPKIEGEDSEGDCRERSDCSLFLSAKSAAQIPTRRERR